jgi:two-component sensor histidine kinase
MSLTHRLLALTLAASLPGMIALTYNALDLRNRRYAEVRAEALRTTQAVVAELDQVFDGIQGTLHAVSEADEVYGASNATCTDYIMRVRSNIQAVTAILVVGLDGNIRCVSEPNLAAPNLTTRDYFRDAVDRQRFSIGPFTTSKLSNRNIIPMALPIVRDGKAQGAIVAGLDLVWLGRQLSKRGLARGGSAIIADRRGVIIAREPEPQQFVGKTIAPVNMHLVRSQTSGTADIVGPDGTPRIVGYMPPALTSFELYVSAGIAQTEASAPIDRAVGNSIALYGLGTAIAFLLAWLVGEGIIRRPLMQMVATAEAWRRGHDAARTGITDRSDEIGILGQTIDRLMDENAQREHERACAEERREILVHELAHRVKNTLATVQSIASLSFRHSQGPEALRQFQDRLQALVRSHDLLTRKNWQHADLAEVAEAAMAPLKQERGHRFSITGPVVDLPPTTAVPMAMILHELCTNALKYGALSNEHGRVTITWTARTCDQGLAVSLLWNESDGPVVTPPTVEGFGTRLIQNLSRQLNGESSLRYPPSGFSCHLRFISPKEEPRD